MANNGLAKIHLQSFTVSDSNIFGGSWGDGVFLSMNNGTSWTAINNGLTNTRVSSLATIGNNIFAGTNGGGVYLSTNNGTSWTAVNSGLVDVYVFDLVVSGTNIFAGTNSGIFLSTNIGTSWKTVNNGLPNDEVTALASSDGAIFAGMSSSGVYMSTNNGTNWMPRFYGLPKELVMFLAVCDEVLFAGFYDYGVWGNPILEMSGTSNPQLKNASNKTSAFTLTQPSRSARTLSINFSLPNSELVSVKIYNLSGHEIATLVNQNLSSGPHCLQWDTRAVANGCYMVRMQAGSNTYVRSVPIFR